MATKIASKHPPQIGDRVPIKDVVKRQLYLLSGNCCPYPECGKPLIGPDGVVDLQIAHIHGVKPDSARHDTSLAPDSVAAFENLLLMCRKHHWHIDNEGREHWPADKLRALKQAHEAKYEAGIESIEAADVASRARFIPSETGAWFGLDETGVDRVPLERDLAALNAFGQKLAELPPGPRQVLALGVRHGTPNQHGRGTEVTISADRLQQQTALPDFDAHLRILREVGYLDWETDERHPDVWLTSHLGPDVRPLAELARRAHVDEPEAPDRALVHLDFTVFDSPWRPWR